MENPEMIEQLEKISTPIVYDGIEKFHIQSNTLFYTDETLRCIFPEKGAMCGYACTAKITGVLPKAESEIVIPSKAVWEYVYDSRKPGVMVIEDIDGDPKRACAWGDFSASIFEALGCIGTLTNGFVRDVDVVKDMPFKFFARSVIAGHGNIRYKEIGVPVRIAGMTINPGDLIHADIHGAVVIPGELDLGELLAMIQKCLDSEGKVISYCKGSNFTLEGLFAEVDEHDKRSGSHFK
ncbi:MAG: RraA family protein [Oscillospiraceae bacterium]|nr:RraA family protein [Oscillospiraceae bacterium]